ncbi:DUF397 domain-containing protein [Streptomyces paludis]|uniref:DUF397 domain-containing protein n=1 Tax=Streptomyces paludis TaxID=2282738 RepID=A0A345HND5_9ACTN|nr:DUF397 domain-containing protein [Streptomyces paludis]
MAHIHKVAQQQNVCVQVLPLSEWQAAHLSSHFVMFSLGPELQAVVYDTTASSVVLEDLDASAGPTNDCVEVAHRDSGTQFYTSAEWAAFLDGLKSGDLGR